MAGHWVPQRIRRMEQTLRHINEGDMLAASQVLGQMRHDPTIALLSKQLAKEARRGETTIERAVQFASRITSHPYYWGNTIEDTHLW